MRKRDSFNYRLFMIKNIFGFLAIVLLLSGLYLLNGGIPQSLVVNETIPFLSEARSNTGSYKIFPSGNGTSGKEELTPTFTSILGEDDITYQPETDINLIQNSIHEEALPDDIEKLKDLNYLKKNFYIVDSRTDLTSDDVNIDEFLSKNLTIDQSVSGPKVLIFHTHSTEGFADSNMQNWKEEGIYGAGERLSKILKEKYNIDSIHNDGRYDMVDGRGQILGAYERMEPEIRKIIAANPSIQVVIDMHRDGVDPSTKLVTEINGKKYAQIMFFNGLCKLNSNGTLKSIDGLSNPYVKDNLALSFNMKLSANRLFPTLTRKIYINAYRYSLHMLPKSMLIEVGAQTNTKEEIFNSMEPLADILADVVLKK